MNQQIAGLTDSSVKKGQIPKYHELMRPVLELCSDGQEHQSREIRNRLADRFQLSEEQLAEMLPSGQQTVFDNRVGWARTYLTKAGLIEKIARGVLRITEQGQEFVRSGPESITAKDLDWFGEFSEFRRTTRGEDGADSGESVSTISLEDEEEELTPEESLELGYQKLRRAVMSEVLERVKGCSPAFFERLVVELLLKMGYGGSRMDAGQAMGRSGDGGIDGIIKEDRLGLDSVYIQAKRWDETVVGRPEVQKFAGA